MAGRLEGKVCVITGTGGSMGSFANLGALAHRTAKAGITAMTRHLATEEQIPA